MTNQQDPAPAAHKNKGGQKMRAYRKKMALTQTQLGELFGLSANIISRYERGERLPDLPLAVLFQAEGICLCEDWTCDPAPRANEPRESPGTNGGASYAAAA